MPNLLLSIARRTNQHKIKVSVDGVSIDHFKDGQIISGFDAWDALGFRQQLDLDR